MKPAQLRLVRAVGIPAFLLTTVACATTGARPKPFPMPGKQTAGTTASPAAELRDSGAYALVGTALGLRGVPYHNGGSDARGFDCSGFTQYVFAHHGMALPRETRDQFRVGTRVEPDAVRPGDLLFFSVDGRGPSHVGIAVGGDQFVHAPTSNGSVRVDRLSARYWMARYLGARRVTPP